MRLYSPLIIAAALITAALPAHSTVTGFVGPWAPTLANGFTNSTGGSSTFTTSVSPDGLTLTSQLDNNGNYFHDSFFLQNYSFTVPPGLLPPGPVSYDYSITMHSPFGIISEFDDFGHSGFFLDGQSITGAVSYNYPGGFFEYFGINIDDFAGSATATVTLTDFSGPSFVAEPTSLLLLATGLIGLARGRRRSN